MKTLSNVLHWMKIRFLLIPKRDNRNSFGLIFIFWIASSISAVIYAVGNPTGASFIAHASNIGKMAGLNSLLFIVATILLGGLFSFLYIPLPRLFLGGFIYVALLNIGILLEDSSGTLFSIGVGIGYSVVVSLIGLILMLFMRRKRGRMVLLVLFGSFIIINSTILLVETFSSQDHTIQVIKESSDKIENPAGKGEYDYTFFTYGSGEDLQREAFGEAVDTLTPTLDASDWITNWKDSRKEFWGYDATDLPVNGRVWLPEGEGPFPIMLMVHGNHAMEEFSTDGYDYLGELLASRGFIAISVDEDFINYSNVSGSPNDNYKLRAWMILQHITELQTMNQSPDNMLYGKIDFDQVALMGHSRGGQAVLMAADYATYFDDENLVESMDQIDIKGVISVAPTDKKIDGNKPHLHNTSYLFLGGGRDADVSDFRGDRQYYRTTFDADDDGFKSTLYIADANHTQFNTSWGRSDLSLPRGLFLNHRDVMEADAQRQIAKVYMGAFLESIFHDKTAYKELFKDYRYGSEWLPDTTLVNKYQDAAYSPVVQYKQNQFQAYEVDGFKSSEVITPTDRNDNNRLSDALQLEWETEASYTINLANESFMTSTHEIPEQIVLTMANMDAEAEDGQVPDIEIEFETIDGTSVQLPLDDFASFPSVISTKFTAFGLFDGIFRDGKYERSWAPVFQTFAIPMEAFEEDATAFAVNDIDKLTLHFRSHPGKILVEEIGVQ